jgi:beta-glucosidase
MSKKTYKNHHKVTKKPLAIVASLGLLAGSATAQTLPQLGRDPLQRVLAALTQEEKVALVMGQGMQFPGLDEAHQAPVVGVSNSKVPGAAGTTFPVPRLGIPSIVLADGPAGVRIAPSREGQPGASFYATAFPIGSALATSWDVELVRQVGAAIGDEARAYGIDIMLTPAQNIHRYPLGGRNFEYYSEDPLLSGTVSAAMVRGIQSRGVAASVKHFAVNNHEWNRNTINVKVDERALREIYLKGFQIALEQGQPWTVMSSYNKINGHYTSEDGWLLDEVLRKQWGYDGLVMTDWFGGRDAVAQMHAGNELLMPGTVMQKTALLSALEDGRLDERVLDRNVTRVLQLVEKSITFKGVAASNRPDLKADAALSRHAATQGMVLLENHQAALPLKPAAKVALLGNSSYHMITGGTGSGDVNKAYSVSLLQGLNAAGFSTDAGLARDYQVYLAEQTAKLPETQWYLPKPAIGERELDAATLQRLAQQYDVGLLTLGRASGEFVDRKAEDDFELSQVELRLLQRASQAFHAQGKQLVVVLNIGGVIETASWRGLADAILLAWQPGQEAGHAITDVLSGTVNPSAKLADTFALRLRDYPAAQGFPGRVLVGPAPDDTSLLGNSAREAEVEYHDGIWVGYRHFNTRNAEVAYPFGYGLSYTDFDYSDLTLEHSADSGLQATVKVRNTGTRAGSEVVQVYVSAPQTGLQKPREELRAFAKTGLLQPGQAQTLKFEIAGRELASYDASQGRWVAAAGSYQLRVGASSRDIRLQRELHKAATQYAP